MLYFESSRPFSDFFKADEGTLFFGRIINGSGYYADCDDIPKSYSCPLKDLEKFGKISFFPFNELYHQINRETEARRTIDGGLTIRRKKESQNLNEIIEPEATFSRTDYGTIKKCFEVT